MENIEEIAERFLEEFRRGKRPSVADYARRYEALAEEINDLFPALILLEDGGRKESLSSFGPTFKEDVSSPEQIDNYKIIREIGRGGMGVVYEANDEALDRKVALKVLRSFHGEESQAIKRFRREAQTAARLHHTNIVPVFGYGIFDEKFYYVMQYIYGTSLEELLRRLARQQKNNVGVGKFQIKFPSTKPPFPFFKRTSNRPASSNNGDRLDLTEDFNSSFDSDRSGPDDDRFNAERFSSALDGFARPDVCSSSPGGSARLDDGSNNNGSASSNSFNRWNDVLTSGEKKGFSSGLFLTDFCDRSLSYYYQKVCDVGVQTARALHYAHQHRILHRDVKPANLILDDQGIVWITDFGLAKPFEGNDLTQCGQLIGTLRYMSPESLEGVFSPQSDVYSLGLTLYELLTLSPAFGETNYARLLKQIGESEFVAPRKRNGNIPKDLETIVLKATSKNPERRYQTAADLADDLTRFLEDRPIHARRVSGIERFWRLCKRNKLTSGLLATIFFLLILLSSFMSAGYFHSRTLLYEKELEKIRAQTNLDLAVYAFDDIFSLFIGKEKEDLFPFLGHDASLTMTLDEPLITEKEANLLESLLTFYDRYAIENADDQNLLTETARAYIKMGVLRYRLGQSDAALEACKTSFKFYKQSLNFVPDKERKQLEMIVVMNKFLSQLKMPILSDPFVRNAIDQMIETLEKMPEIPESSRIQRQELSSLLFLRVSLVLFDYMKAKQIETEPNDSARYQELLAEMRNDSTLTDKIERDMLYCSRLIEGLLEQYPQSTDILMNKGKIDCFLALCKLLENEPSEALKLMNGSVELAERLFEQNPDDSLFKINKISILFTASFLLKFDRDEWNRQEQELLLAALATTLELTREHPQSPLYVVFQIFVQYRLAIYYFETGDFESSENYFRLNEEAFATFLANFPHYHDFYFFATPHYYYYIKLLISQQKFDEAKEKLDRYLERNADLSTTLQSQKLQPTSRAENDSSDKLDSTRQTPTRSNLTNVFHSAEEANDWAKRFEKLRRTLDMATK